MKKTPLLCEIEGGKKSWKAQRIFCGGALRLMYVCRYACDYPFFALVFLFARLTLVLGYIYSCKDILLFFPRMC